MIYFVQVELLFILRENTTTITV